MLQKLKTLHTILGSNGFILTGSTALAYHGLLEISEAKDLDILLVKPDQGALDVLNKLQAANPSAKFREGGPVKYSFIYEDVKVDVWILDSHEDSTFTCTPDGIRIASIRSIVNAKKHIGRSKDWIHLMQLANKIFDKNQFDSALSQISNHSESYTD